MPVNTNDIAQPCYKTSSFIKRNKVRKMLPAVAAKEGFSTGNIDE
ncbi:MAG TPA: hypothetical protein VNT20_18650 [Flavisolibacter sp.]|jgi:hypothetical protein|nr:hypothetical protein [Flavisolibacter sp.]